MKEVYRSFEGKLGVSCPEGYIIYDLSEFYQVDFLTVYQGAPDSSVRLRKNVFTPDHFDNEEYILSLEMDIEHGRADHGQYLYKGKWYSVSMIRAIQKAHHDGNWRRYA